MTSTSCRPFPFGSLPIGRRKMKTRYGRHPSPRQAGARGETADILPCARKRETCPPGPGGHAAYTHPLQRPGYVPKFGLKPGMPGTGQKPGNGGMGPKVPNAGLNPGKPGTGQNPGNGGIAFRQPGQAKTPPTGGSLPTVTHVTSRQKDPAPDYVALPGNVKPPGRRPRGLKTSCSTVTGWRSAPAAGRIRRPCHTRHRRCSPARHG
jgi:hypothetical protein